MQVHGNSPTAHTAHIIEQKIPNILEYQSTGISLSREIWGLHAMLLAPVRWEQLLVTY